MSQVPPPADSPLSAILQISGDVATVVVLLEIVAALILWARGVLPVLYRLGNGLGRRKIALLARGDNAASLTQLLTDSGLVRKGNISGVQHSGDLDRATETSVVVVYWPDWASEIEAILNAKRDSTPLLIYAPQEHGFIPKDIMGLLDRKRNVFVSNFRGRLLGDLVMSMIVTSYAPR